MSNTSALPPLVFGGLKKSREVEVIQRTYGCYESGSVTIRILDKLTNPPLTEVWEISLPQQGAGTSTLLARFAEQADTTPKLSGLVPDKEE